MAGQSEDGDAAGLTGAGGADGQPGRPDPSAPPGHASGWPDHRSGSPPPPSAPAGRPGSGALLPGDWVQAADPGAASQAGRGGADSQPGRAGPWGRVRWWRRQRPRHELRGRRLAIAAAALALACTMLGGVIGGFIALHSDQPQTDPTYNLGTVPPTLNARPATSVAGIAARVTPSVVMIKVANGEGTGSGFVIRGGYIVTDNHVVTLDNEVTNGPIEVYFSNGTSAPGAIVGQDPYSDIAIIRALGVSGLPALSLGNSTSVQVGDPVLAVGSPLGLADTVTSGIVSALDRPVQPGSTGTSPQVYFDAIQTDAPINPGNSGGPLVNAQGQVIGVDAAIDTLGENPLTGTQGGSIGLGFAIPVNEARRVALELIRTGHATHAVLGADIDANWAGTGAEIMPASARRQTVAPGGPAARAGLQPGDVIVRFDGQPVDDADTLLDALRSAAPGSRVSVTFLRGGQPDTVLVRLGSAPS
jgi:putative serine protease PepD